MTLGTEEEIHAQALKVRAAEDELMKVKLRLRALKGEPLFRSGDSASPFELAETLEALSKEFGSRNLRMM